MRTQCHCHRTTHTHTPTFNAARTTTKHHIPIQNDHRATRTHTHQASKCSRRQHETPRYDSKWPPRHTRTHARLQNAARTTTGHHVTIENGHRATRKPSIITWCSRFKENIYIIFFSRAPRYDWAPRHNESPILYHNVLKVLCLPRKKQHNVLKCCTCHEKKHNVLKVLHLPRKKVITWSKCCTCHEKESWRAQSAAPARKNNDNVLKVLLLPRKTTMEQV